MLFSNNVNKALMHKLKYFFFWVLVINLVQTYSTANMSLFLFPSSPEFYVPMYINKDTKFKDMKNKLCHVLGNVLLDSLTTE